LFIAWLVELAVTLKHRLAARLRCLMTIAI